MRLLLICHGYPPFGVAGVERVSQQTAESLTARGHEVIVLTRRPTAAPPSFQIERDRRNGVPVVTIAGGGATFSSFPGRESPLEGAFQRVLAEEQPDVVLLSHTLHHSPGYVGIAKRWGIPVAVELHDFFFACPRAHLERVSGERCGGPEAGRACAAHCFPSEDADVDQARWSLRAHLFRSALQDADRVIAPSRFVAERFAEMRRPRAPIVVLGNGVPDSFEPDVQARRRDRSGPLHVASIGVATPHKGFHVVVEALRRARLSAARYTIFGLPTDGYDDELRDAADEVDGLELRLNGGFEPAELPALLADVDLVVVPSLVEETYSIAAREALACGLPVVASRLGALPAAVRHGVTGLLFEPGDAGALAAQLAALDGDRQSLADLAAGVARERPFTVSDRADALERLLRDLVGDRSRAPAGSGDGGEVELRVLRDALTMAWR